LPELTPLRYPSAQLEAAARRWVRTGGDGVAGVAGPGAAGVAGAGAAGGARVGNAGAAGVAAAAAAGVAGPGAVGDVGGRTAGVAGTGAAGGQAAGLAGAGAAGAEGTWATEAGSAGVGAGAAGVVGAGAAGEGEGPQVVSAGGVAGGGVDATAEEGPGMVVVENGIDPAGEGGGPGRVPTLLLGGTRTPAPWSGVVSGTEAGALLARCRSLIEVRCLGRLGPNLKPGTLCVCGMSGLRKGMDTTQHPPRVNPNP